MIIMISNFKLFFSFKYCGIHYQLLALINKFTLR